VTERQIHIASVVPVAFIAVAFGYHPIVAIPLLAGVVLPDVDAVAERFHRSWVFHTLLIPSTVYVLLDRIGALTQGSTVAINFVALGMAIHLVADFVYPREMTHSGAGWPVRPVLISSPWGLLWLGVAWTAQWFGYIAPVFIPWLVGYSA